MKRIQADYPFEDYWLYVVLHKKENRRMANLVKKDTLSKERMTISYARYLMSVNLKRKLNTDEHVDHIDNDKLNDCLSNLQILSPEENSKKEMSLSTRRKKFNPINCCFCGTIFSIETRQHKSRLKNGAKNFYCSKICQFS